MAERRMFAKSIIDSDLFLDMPASAQNLYFHLGMRADDDGFVSNPKRIVKMINTSDDDLRILFAKKFIITFKSGVIVVTHWRIHNTIQKDRYKPTLCEEKALLRIENNNVYTLDTKCIQNGNTIRLISLDKLDELSNEEEDFKTFKINFLSKYPNFGFRLIGKLGYSEDHTGFQIRGGYIFDLHTQKIIDSNEAFKIWLYLFEHRNQVLQNAELQKNQTKEF